MEHIKQKVLYSTACNVYEILVGSEVVFSCICLWRQGKYADGKHPQCEGDQYVPSARTFLKLWGSHCLMVHLHHSSANTWLLFCCSFKFKSPTVLFKLSSLNSELFSYWVDDNGIKWFSVFFNPLLFIYSWRGEDKNPDRDRNPLSQ